VYTPKHSFEITVVMHGILNKVSKEDGLGLYINTFSSTNL
jgi:hypothetical protein